MKRKLDVYLLYFSYVVELIYLFSARIFNNYESTHTIHVSESGKPIFGNMKIYLDISIFSYYLFFAIMILYILFVFFLLYTHSSNLDILYMHIIHHDIQQKPLQRQYS